MDWLVKIRKAAVKHDDCFIDKTSFNEQKLTSSVNSRIILSSPAWRKKSCFDLQSSLKKGASGRVLLLRFGNRSTSADLL